MRCCLNPAFADFAQTDPVMLCNAGDRCTEAVKEICRVMLYGAQDLRVRAARAMCQLLSQKQVGLIDCCARPSSGRVFGESAFVSRLPGPSCPLEPLPEFRTCMVMGAGRVGIGPPEI